MAQRANRPRPERPPGRRPFGGVSATDPLDPNLPPWLLPKPRKKLLYLDQGPLSDLAKILDSESPRHERALKDEFLREVGLRVERLVKLQLAICPMSFFHHAESLLSEDPSYATIHDVGEYLSDGCTFLDKETLIEWQLGHAFEAFRKGASVEPIARRSLMNTGTIDEWTQRWKVIVEPRPMRGEVENARVVREARKREMAAEFAKWQQSPPRPVGDAAAEGIEEIRAALIKATLAHRAMRRAANGDLDALTDALDDSGRLQVLLHGLLPTHFVAETEAQDQYDAALAFLRSPALADVPFLKLSTILWPALAWKRTHGQKQEPPSVGTETDISIVASLLPYCDAMLIDVEMATLLREEPLLRDEVAAYGTRVFSRRDKEPLLRYLDEIEHSASPEHMELLRRIYRDLEGWLKPYTGVLRARRRSRERRPG